LRLCCYASKIREESQKGSLRPSARDKSNTAKVTAMAPLFHWKNEEKVLYAPMRNEENHERFMPNLQ
jgi:hypothetical protein